LKLNNLFKNKENMNDDINLIYEVFENETYRSPIVLEDKISKIKNKRLSNGLIIDLYCMSETYKFDRDSIIHLLDTNKTYDDGISDHNYYIDFISNGVKPVFYDFLISRDIGYCKEFSSWIKSLYNKDIDIIIDYCIELEIFEAIPYIKDIRENKESKINYDF
jgi:hypothetical protein